jgi:hypothetical protein
MLLRPEHVKAEIAKGQDRRVACGNSLYLLVRNGNGFWELRYRDGSAIRSHGLGPASGENVVTPAAARRAREAFMADKRRGIVVVPRRAKGEASRRTRRAGISGFTPRLRQTVSQRNREAGKGDPGGQHQGGVSQHAAADI